MKGRIVILGGGESGLGAALLAKQKGYEVLVSDSNQLPELYKNELQLNRINFEEHHNLDEILKGKLIIKSPGIPEKNEIVQKIRSAGIELISEIEFAYRHKGESKMIAITGSNGKSTTTAMVYHICKEAGLSCALVGNIGYSFARQVAEDPKDIYVVEVSSFQLDDAKDFHPDVAILTNITEDHLDRYEYKIENYIKSKFSIIKNQDSNDVFIYCMDDEITMKNINNFLNNTFFFL